MENKVDFDEKNLRKYPLKILLPDEEIINGTGFFCHREGYILTCYHVIKPYLEINKAEVRVVYQNENRKRRNKDK